MKSIGGAKVLVLPVLLVASVTFASAQEGVKREARETKQDGKDAAGKSGNAIKDSWITMNVHSQFMPEDALEGSDIDVDTKNGVVMLNGTVTSEAGRTRAMAIAKGTNGVKSVMDHLRIAADAGASARAADKSRDAGRTAADNSREAGRTAGDKTREAGRDAKNATKDATGTTGRTVTDGWVKSKIAAQFVSEDSLDNSDIDIDVTKGVVVLSGAVRTPAARTRAAAIVKATDGVKSVSNNLKVDPSVK